MNFCMPYDLFVNVDFLMGLGSGGWGGGALTRPICSAPQLFQPCYGPDDPDLSGMHSTRQPLRHEMSFNRD